MNQQHSNSRGTPDRTAPRAAAALLLALLGLGAVAPASGPDGFGYTCLDSNEAGGPAFSWVDATAGTALGITDDEEIVVTLPFDFTFYGQVSDSMVVGNNGAILFGRDMPDEVAGSNFSLASAPPLFIAPFWDDIDDETGDVYLLTSGAMPNRTFTVSWVDRPHHPATGAASFQVVFQEGSNTLLFQYLDVDFGDSAYDNGASANVGIRGAFPGHVLEYSDNTPALAANLAVQFSPPTATSAEFSASSFQFSDSVSRDGKTNHSSLQITNSGSGASTTTLVTSPIPVGASYVASSLAVTGGSPATFNAGMNRIEWGPEGVSAGSTVLIEWEVTYAAASPQLISSNASIEDATEGTTNLQANVEIIDPPLIAGTDTYGYFCLDSYSTGGPVFDWMDATAGTALGLNDEDETNVTAPFPLFLYGQESTDLRIGNNGAILFGETTGTVSFMNDAVSSATVPLIAPFWDDLGDSGDVFTHVTGSAPNRRFIVQWNNIQHFTFFGAATFQVVFEEGEDDILMQYLDVQFQPGAAANLGGRASVGISSGAGPGAGESVQYSLLEPWLEDGLAVLYVLPGTPTDVADWMAY